MTLEAIKEAISELPAPEKTTLVQWLNQQDSEAWDREIEEDFSESGAGMALRSMGHGDKGRGFMSLDDFLSEQGSETSK